MKNATLISVVIPAYNAEQFLDETLDPFFPKLMKIGNALS